MNFLRIFDGISTQSAIKLCFFILSQRTLKIIGFCLAPPFADFSFGALKKNNKYLLFSWAKLLNFDGPQSFPGVM